MTWVDVHIRHKQRGDKTLFCDLNLNVAEGEFVCLVGPSGCGKTSLLDLLAGLDPHYEGHIAFARPPASTRIGYVFQEPRLLPWRTVAENIRLALPPGIDPVEVEQLFAQVGLTDIQNLYPPQLSLGMSRRVALVRAFAIQPDVLLMDEPLVSLDPPTARKIRQLLLQLWRERPHTILFVTHDLREAIELADRLIFLSASPCRICGDIRVELSHQQRNETVVEDFRKSLMADFPALQGIL
jgi:NitT/TauT family transport system ATP-binding protein